MKYTHKFKQWIALVGALTLCIAPTVEAKVSPWAETQVKTFLKENYKATENYTALSTREEFSDLCYQVLTECNVDFSNVKPKTFSDTSNVHIQKLAAYGILNGISETKFAPKSSITRQEMACIMVRMFEKLNKPLNKTITFSISDEKAVASWALDAVKKAYEANLLKGETNAYNPKATITL